MKQEVQSMLGAAPGHSLFPALFTEPSQGKEMAAVQMVALLGLALVFSQAPHKLIGFSSE